jgi:hypothetical protein
MGGRKMNILKKTYEELTIAGLKDFAFCKGGYYLFPERCHDRF